MEAKLKEPIANISMTDENYVAYLSFIEYFDLVFLLHQIKHIYFLFALLKFHYKCRVFAAARGVARRLPPASLIDTVFWQFPHITISCYIEK